MKEQLISFETAKLAKQKGFRVDSGYSYSRNEKLLRTIDTVEFVDTPKENLFVAFAPTQSLLQKWLREEKKIYVTADINPVSGNYEWFIHSILSHDKNVEHFAPLLKESGGYDYIEYEEALEVGLQVSLKLIR